MEFPPGSTILIPSSMLLHSNTSIQPEEVQYSIVQYASGHLFRWVDNGFLNGKEWKERATAQELQQWEQERDSRWLSALGSFTTLQQLEQTEEEVRAKLGKRKREP